MTRSTPRPPGYVAGTWTIDSSRSTVAFTIRHLLIHKVDTGDAGRDKGTLAKDPFDIAHHPVTTYHSTGLAPDGQAWQLEGELTLRGITHDVSLHVQQYEFTSGATGEHRARFFANRQHQSPGVRGAAPSSAGSSRHPRRQCHGIELLIEAIRLQARA